MRFMECVGDEPVQEGTWESTSVPQLRMKKPSEVHTRTLVPFNHLDSGWTLLSYNFLS